MAISDVLSFDDYSTAPSGAGQSDAEDGHSKCKRPTKDDGSYLVSNELRNDNFSNFMLMTPIDIPTAERLAHNEFLDVVNPSTPNYDGNDSFCGGKISFVASPPPTLFTYFGSPVIGSFSFQTLGHLVPWQRPRIKIDAPYVFPAVLRKKLMDSTKDSEVTTAETIVSYNGVWRLVVPDEGQALCETYNNYAASRNTYPLPIIYTFPEEVKANNPEEFDKHLLKNESLQDNIECKVSEVTEEELCLRNQEIQVGQLKIQQGKQCIGNETMQGSPSDKFVSKKRSQHRTVDHCGTRLIEYFRDILLAYF